MKIKARLQLIVQWILAGDYKNIWDVGTDHGAIPIVLSQTLPKSNIIASDISSQVIDKLSKKTQHIDNITCVVANGLASINNEVDIVIIAGLGIRKIHQVLMKDDEKIKSYIIQSNRNLKAIRQWIYEQNFFIEKENILLDKRHYYFTILVNKKEGTAIKTGQDIVFGPLLLQQREALFMNFWQKEKNKMQQLTAKITQLGKKQGKKKEIMLISQMLKNDANKIHH